MLPQERHLPWHQLVPMQYMHAVLVQTWPRANIGNQRMLKAMNDWRMCSQARLRQSLTLIGPQGHLHRGHETCKLAQANEGVGSAIQHARSHPGRGMLELFVWECEMLTLPNTLVQMRLQLATSTLHSSSAYQSMLVQDEHVHCAERADPLLMLAQASHPVSQDARKYLNCLDHSALVQHMCH